MKKALNDFFQLKNLIFLIIYHRDSNHAIYAPFDTFFLIFIIPQFFPKSKTPFCFKNRTAHAHTQKEPHPFECDSFSDAAQSPLSMQLLFTPLCQDCQKQ